MIASEATQPGMLRAVSRWQLVGMAINDVVGSGVYLLPATAAAMLGSASVWAVIVAGFAVSLLVLCFADGDRQSLRPAGRRSTFTPARLSVSSSASKSVG